MKLFIGNWQLLENKNLDKFLEYYGYGWLAIKAALIANVDAYFEKTENKDIIKRTIDSTFLKGIEEYNFDGNFHLNSADLRKKHSLRDGKIFSEVYLEQKFWTEEIIIEKDQLILNRYWNINNIAYNCTQIFKKVTN